MSLSAQDIVALARAGYTADQISLINKESLSTPSTDQSTPSTPPTPSTPSTDKPEESTPSTPSTPSTTSSEKPEESAPTQAPAPDPGPTMQDLMDRLAKMEKRFTTASINSDQQPAQQDVLTGEKVLANIIDPRESKED